jgi:predicted dehydrogenase
VPKTFDWDLWLGPVVGDRDYHPAYTEGGKWRSWWDFGGGTLADMACHYCDLPFWALKLRHPTRVHATGPELNPEMCAVWSQVEYDFPARGDLPAVKLYWYDGGKRPERLAKDDPNWKGDGVLFVGEKGCLISGYGEHKLLPENDFKGFARPAPTIPKSIGHHREWVEACKSGGATTCNFDYSGALTEAVLLGVVSLRVGKPLNWDAETLTAKGCPEAAKLIRREYRKGWEIG